MRPVSDASTASAALAAFPRPAAFFPLLPDRPRAPSSPHSRTMTLSSSLSTASSHSCALRSISRSRSPRRAFRPAPPPPAAVAARSPAGWVRERRAAAGIIEEEEEERRLDEVGAVECRREKGGFRGEGTERGLEGTEAMFWTAESNGGGFKRLPCSSFFTR